MNEPWRLYNLDYNLDKLKSHINEISKWIDSPFTWPIKDSKWVDVSDILDINLINVVENTIGTTIKKTNYWLWYYNTSKELKPHLDKYFNNCKYSIIVPIIGDFELTSYLDHNNLYNWEPGIEEDIDVNQLTVVDKISYKPGQFLLLNNTVYPHSGIAKEPNRITLHLYLEDNNYE
jgi:hypothetical protein|tara:strand:- start:6813 stop:7340 length:528 start_codon:yes stop_codon:yes gene_type:complete